MTVNCGRPPQFLSQELQNCARPSSVVSPRSVAASQRHAELQPAHHTRALSAPPPVRPQCSPARSIDVILSTLPPGVPQPKKQRLPEVHSTGSRARNRCLVHRVNVNPTYPQDWDPAYPGRCVEMCGWGGEKSEGAGGWRRSQSGMHAHMHHYGRPSQMALHKCMHQHGAHAL